MPDWLSSTWEANWRSFQYFNLYRLIVAAFFCLALVFPNEWSSRMHLVSTPALVVLTGGYAAATLAGLLLATHWRQRFNMQLSLQMLLDVVVVTLLMIEAGGIASGLGLLLLVSLTAGSLVGRGRLVLLYAAVATIAVLGMQISLVLIGAQDQTTIFQAGLVSAVFFATAILARLLGQRLMANEELARRRGIALDNQIRISQRVVERMQDGVLIVARDGSVSHSNPVAQAMLGLPAAGGFVLAARVPTLAAALQVWLEGGEDVPHFSGADGRELQARFEPTNSSDGEILVFLEDIGRIKERAQHMKLASLGRLTASIAHEIRNPLSAIGHAGELLREERRGEMQDRLLRILNDNVVRLDRIVQDVLELGRQGRALPELIPLADFCSGFIENFRSTAGVAEEVIVLDADESLQLCFDRSHLNQVLWNLVANAVRHSRQQAGSVHLRVQAGATPGRVELHVQDDGPGVPEAAREQIFEPFFTTHTQGTGLGLFIARELCATNGALLELAPAVGGAHFIVSGRNDTCLLPEAIDAHMAR